MHCVCCIEKCNNKYAHPLHACMYVGGGRRRCLRNYAGLRSEHHLLLRQDERKSRWGVCAAVVFCTLLGEKKD